MLTVKRLESYNYEVSGEGINATVKYYDKYDYSVKGKGSRTNKEEIVKAVQQFLVNEREQKELAAQQEKDNFRKTLNNANIDLTGLYNVTVNKDESYYGYGLRKSNTIMTGLELLNEYDAIAYEPYKINNTDIYTISVMDRMVHADERLLKIDGTILVTGLALKEKLLTGLKSYGKIRKAVSHELRILQELGKQNKSAMILGAKFDLNKELEMSKRYNNEMFRAYNTFEEPSTPVKYTEDGKEIKYAWFSSKVFEIDNVAKYDSACLEKYVVAETITISPEQFEKFSNTFNMEDLNSTFTGGTNSTYEPIGECEDFYQLSEVEQGKWIKGAYNLALEVKIEGENFSLLIDPQGYDYARYMSIQGEYKPEITRAA